jgi:RNA polymerase sigma factor (sigma-70 family)
VGQPRDHQACDADLVRGALAGAREPFAELVRRHQRTAAALAARVLGSDDLARDAVQEAAVAAMTGLDRLRSPDRFGPWFCGIALNVSRRWLRQLRAEWPDAGPDRADASAGARPDELAELADVAGRVRAAIAGLADGQRDAVFLFYLQGLSHREVAAELGVSVGAVKSRLHQARAALAPRLAPLVEIEEGTAVNATTGAQEWIDVRVAEVRRADGDPAAPDGYPAARKHIMVLEAADGRGRLPIWVGPAEATALALTLEAVETPRPMTYQLAASLLAAAGARATEARITRLDGGTYYAVVLVDGPAGPSEVDARPSDAVTLAAMADVPIRVDARVFAAEADAAGADETGGPDWQAWPTGAAELAAETGQRMREWRGWPPLSEIMAHPPAAPEGEGHAS